MLSLMIKDIVKFIVLLFITFIVTQIVVLFFYLLRFWTDRNNIPPNWVIIMNPIVILINGYVVYVLGKKIRNEPY